MPRHLLHFRLILFSLSFAFATLLLSCRFPQFADEMIITVTADGKTRDISAPAGSTAAEALQLANVIPGNLDKTDPPPYTVLNEGDHVILVRVKETFETEEVIIPYEQQIVRNETLAEGDRRLVQAGENGLEEVTIRILVEDDVEISRSIVRKAVIQEALPEIVMVGALTAHTPINFPGILAYLAGGNAWVMEDSTANRRVIVSTGDLDGRIFTLSSNGEYLIFTRKSQKSADEEINSLWAVRTWNLEPKLISLQAINVVHFASWIPGTNSVAYSTVEPRRTPPGWQANNDLYRISITGGSPRKLLSANSGGVYGWWGMNFAYSPDGLLAYSRPDGIGLVDQDGGYLKPLLEITPLNTHSDWAWIPPMTWSTDGNSLYYVSHASAAAPVSSEESPYFDLSAVSFRNEAAVSMVESTGMFAYPSVSINSQDDSEAGGQIAYLQSIFIEQSDTSRYRLMVMDRDGSNKLTLFPPNDSHGLEPQLPIWAPGTIDGQTGDFIALIYQGNLWMIDSASGRAFQLTGDGLISKMDWK